MSSLLTNTSSMVALQTLRSINANLDQTNNRVSTGLRVNSAADNAAYWSIATTIKSDSSALGAVKDSLGVGKSSVDTVSTGLDTARNALQMVKEKLVSASQPGVDRAKLQTEISSLLKQIKSTADNTVAGGANWLAVDSSDNSYNATKTIVASFARSGDSVSVSTIDIETESVKLYDDHQEVKTAVTDAIEGTWDDYNTAKATADTAYTTAVDTADTAYDTAIATADTAFEADGDAAARDVAYAAATAARASAYATGKTDWDDAIATATDTMNTDLSDASVDGNGDAVQLGIMDRVRTAVADDGSVMIGSVSDIDVSSLTDSDYDLAKVGNMLKMVDAALLDMTDASTTLGAASARLTAQTTFVDSLMDANARAVGTLVDANMEEESTKLKALQTQQQLAVQSLSIANANSQNILSLFRN